MFQQVGQVIGPMQEMLQAVATRAHLSDLHTQVEDYDTVRDQVVAWVDTQPPYLQSAYKHVIQQGTAEEVVDLISRFRAETGIQAQAPAAAPTPAPVARPRSSELPSPAKQAVQALAPVGTTRSSIPQADDPSDFDGAFARFASKS